MRFKKIFILIGFIGSFSVLNVSAMNKIKNRHLDIVKKSEERFDIKEGVKLKYENDKIIKDSEGIMQTPKDFIMEYLNKINNITQFKGMLHTLLDDFLYFNIIDFEKNYLLSDKKLDIIKEKIKEVESTNTISLENKQNLLQLEKDCKEEKYGSDEKLGYVFLKDLVRILNKNTCVNKEKYYLKNEELEEDYKYMNTLDEIIKNYQNGQKKEMKRNEYAYKMFLITREFIKIMNNGYIKKKEDEKLKQLNKLNPKEFVEYALKSFDMQNTIQIGNNKITYYNVIIDDNIDNGGGYLKFISKTLKKELDTYYNSETGVLKKILNLYFDLIPKEYNNLKCKFLRKIIDLCIEYISIDKINEKDIKYRLENFVLEEEEIEEEDKTLSIANEFIKITNEFVKKLNYIKDIEKNKTNSKNLSKLYEIIKKTKPFKLYKYTQEIIIDENTINKDEIDKLYNELNKKKSNYEVRTENIKIKETTINKEKSDNNDNNERKSTYSNRRIRDKEKLNHKIITINANNKDKIKTVYQNKSSKNGNNGYDRNYEIKNKESNGKFINGEYYKKYEAKDKKLNLNSERLKNNKRLNYEITENKKENNNNKEDNSKEDNNKDEKNFIHQQNEKSKTFYSNIKPNYERLNNKRLNYEITEKTETNNNNKCEITTVYTNRKRNHKMISVKVSKTVKPN